jgi:uncharacterized protein (TIGR00255 family)
MRSMTGFGRGEGRAKAVQVVAEIKTVNHKYHDVSIKVPFSYQFLEPEIRDLILSSVSRGKVDFFMKDLSPVRPKTVEVNENLLREYLRAARKAASHFKLKSDLSMENLLRMPDVLMVTEQERQETEQRQAVLEAVRQSLKALEKMRQAEGLRLGKDMLERAKEVSSVVQQIRQRQKAALAEKVRAFKEKVAEFLPEPLQDQTRLATEEGLLLQRQDISEELTRLDSHLEALQQALKEKTSVGRKLDFLMQEMNRETNTIGSKSADSKMAQSVVRLKELLEQLREQIQNIE